MAKDSTQPFIVNHVRVLPDRNVLVGKDGEVRVEPRVMDVLCALASSPSGVMTRHALIDELWGLESGGDESLTRAVSRLRRALREAGGSPEDVETVPKRGYRLTAAIRPLPEGGVDTAQGSAFGQTASGETATGVSSSPLPGRPAWRAVLATCAVALLAVLVAILIFRTPAGGTPQLSGAQREVVIAVLPFDNQSPDAADDYLAAALADEIQFSLTRNNSVSVIAGGSAFRFHDKKQDLKAIAQALNATHIVDGALRRTDLGVRVGVNLIDAGNETIIWSTVEEYADDRIYAIRDRVALEISSALGASASRDCGGAEPVRDPDPGAYETYLQARALYRDGSKENLERAITYLESATAIDPHFADAWATLAMAELNRILYDYAHPRAPVPAARLAAERAVELDPCSIDARLALAIADWRERAKSVQGSGADFAAVLERAPNNPAILSRMGMLYHEVGRLKDSVRMHEKAYRLDPLSASTASYYIWSIYIAGDAEGASALASKSQERWAEGPNMFAVLKFPSLLAAGDYGGARNWAYHFATLNGQSLFPGSSPVSLLVDFVDAVESRDDAAYQAARSELVAAANQGMLLHHYAFEIIAAAGDHADAFDLARERIARDDFWFRGALFRPSLKKFRQDPRVLELFEDNGLLEYWRTSGEWPDFCDEPDLPYDCRDEAALR